LLEALETVAFDKIRIEEPLFEEAEDRSHPLCVPQAREQLQQAAHFPARLTAVTYERQQPSAREVDRFQTPINHGRVGQCADCPLNQFLGGPLAARLEKSSRHAAQKRIFVLSEDLTNAVGPEIGVGKRHGEKVKSQK
jgi:hypothetical protein